MAERFADLVGDGPVASFGTILGTDDDGPDAPTACADESPPLADAFVPHDPQAQLMRDTERVDRRSINRGFPQQVVGDTVHRRDASLRG